MEIKVKQAIFSKSELRQLVTEKNFPGRRKTTPVAKLYIHKGLETVEYVQHLNKYQLHKTIIMSCGV